MLREQIESAVFGKGQGHITEIIEVPNGLLILRVDQNFREGLAELEEVQEEIRARISAPMFQPEIRKYLSELRAESYIEIRPGYADSGTVEGISTAWSDPSRLAPLTTTREEVIKARPRKRVLWMVPLPRGEVDDDQDAGDVPQPVDAGAPTSWSKEHYIKDLRVLGPDERFRSFFLVQAKDLRQNKKTGDPFLSMQLADRTGTLDARMWDVPRRARGPIQRQ